MRLPHITYDNNTVTVICTTIDAPNHRTPYLISQTLQNDSCDFLKELRDNFSDEFEFFICKTSSRCNKTLLPKASHTGQSKQNLSAGRSDLFIGGYRASAEYYQKQTDNWWEVVFMALMNLLSHFYYLFCMYEICKTLLILRFVITCFTDILRIILCIWKCWSYIDMK